MIMSISIISSTRKNKKKVLENTSTSSFARAIKFNVKHYQLLIVNACTWGDTKASSSATLTVNAAEYRCCLSNKTMKFFFQYPIWYAGIPLENICITYFFLKFTPSALFAIQFQLKSVPSASQFSKPVFLNKCAMFKIWLEIQSTLCQYTVQ